MVAELKCCAGSVLILGDLMVDEYWHTSVTRISPEAPVPVCHVRNKEIRAGGAANVAMNCSALGAHTRLIGAHGDDASGNALIRVLKEGSVSFTSSYPLASATIRKLRVMSRGQQLLRLDFEERISTETAEALLSPFEAEFLNFDVVVLSDYAKGTLSRSKIILDRCRRAGKFCIVDPKGEDFERYRGADIITPNMQEFCTVVGPCEDDQELLAKAKGLIEKYDFGGVLITRGEMGVFYVSADGEPISIPAFSHEVFDVTGAGDTVVAALAVAIASGLSVSEAVVLSNVAAGIVVTKVGTSVVTLSELECAIKRDMQGTHLHDRRTSFNRGKVLSIDELSDVREQLRGSDRKLVMTNGCFDVLHAGHVSFLRAAKQRGDVLAVAVNTDDSVRRLKGPTRPINTIEARLAVLASLEDVDFLVSFSEETPLSLYEKVLPDVLVKGADYADKEVVGSDAVVSAGGRVELLEMLTGFSTSRTVKKLESAERDDS